MTLSDVVTKNSDRKRSRAGIRPAPSACVALDRLKPELQSEARRLAFLFDELRGEMNCAAVGHNSALLSLTRLIMVSVLRLCANSVEATPMRHEDLQVFHRFNALIEAHYLEHWALGRYADAIGVTEARLNDVCRRIADLPSKRLVFERVMQEAKRLLLLTGSSASEICYLLGFRDPAYFSRFFLRNEQMTPAWLGVRHQADSIDALDDESRHFV